MLVPRDARHLGALAQLVERLHGMQEVRGSTPLGSTMFSLPKQSKKNNRDASTGKPIKRLFQF